MIQNKGCSENLQHLFNTNNVSMHARNWKFLVRWLAHNEHHYKMVEFMTIKILESSFSEPRFQMTNIYS